jgi:endogenous inhibitor of DNA gyrase (YacG/DUF329 family)
MKKGAPPMTYIYPDKSVFYVVVLLKEDYAIPCENVTYPGAICGYETCQRVQFKPPLSKYYPFCSACLRNWIIETGAVQVDAKKK